MDPIRWEQVRRIFDLASALETSLQAQCVHAAAGDDIEVASEVMAMLQAPSLKLANATSPGTATAPTVYIQPATLAANARIGQFRILERLGQGGMGIVYRAFDETNKRRVALKVLQGAASSLHRFKEEFHWFSECNHDNLVQLYEFFEDSGRWYFSMELVEGQSFLHYLGRPGDASRLRAAFSQLAGAVATLHAANLLHRDLKPSNVMVTPENLVKVLDFGLGVPLNRDGVHENTDGYVLGSLSYMSPEQAEGVALAPASDWYSVGVMLFEALTGRAPFAGSAPEVLRAKHTCDGGRPSDLCPGVPADLDTLCAELLRRNPAERPDTDSILYRLGTPLVAPQKQLFVGRDAELAELATAFKAARRKPLFVHITGQSGAGKTALVDRFLAELPGLPGTVALTGRCLEQESLPFKALDSLIDSLVRYLCHPDQCNAAMPRDVGALARVFPTFERIPAVKAAPLVGGGEPDLLHLRHRAAEALRELLGRISDKHPLVLFIDDLQWGDRDSASFLTDVLTSPHAPNCLGIISYRGEDVAGSQFLTALDEIRQRGKLPFEEQHLTVGDLENRHTRELARCILGSRDAASAAVADEIARESAGRPFLVYELIEHLRSPARGLQTESLSLDSVLWSRIEALPQDRRDFLEIVAIAARPIREIDAADTATLMIRDGSLVPALKASRLIRTTPSGNERRLEVYHDRVREVILGHLAAESLQGHHLRLAGVLSGSSDTEPEILAFHLSRGGMNDQAAVHYASAAAKADQKLAFAHAAQLYRQALDLKVWPVDRQLALRTSLGEALRNAGHGKEAADEYLGAIPYANTAATLDLQHRAALALLTSGRVDDGLEILRPVMRSIRTRIAKTPRSALASLLTRQALLRIRGLRFTERIEAAVDPKMLRRLDIGWSVILGLSVIDPIRGSEFQTRSLLLALRAGEPLRIARALAVEAAHLASSGSFVGANHALAEAERIAKHWQHIYTRGIVELSRGAVAYFEERWNEALQYCRIAAATFQQHCTGATWEINTAHAFSLWSLVKMGSIADLARICPGLLKEARDRGDLYAIANLSTQIMSLVRLAAGDTEGAEKELSNIMEEWSQKNYHVQHHDALLASVPIALYRSRPDDAWTQVREEWSDFRWSLLSHVQDLRIEMLQLRAWCALAMALTCDSPSKFLSISVRDARRLRRERLPWTFALHDYIMGAVSSMRGRNVEAKRWLASAITGFERVDARLQAELTRYRLAGISTGPDATSLRDLAEKWLRAEGIVDVDRMAQAYAPGFHPSQ